MEEFEKYYRSRNKFMIRTSSQVNDELLNNTLLTFDEKLSSVKSYLNNYDMVLLENTSILNSLVKYLKYSYMIDEKTLLKGIGEERSSLSKKMNKQVQDSNDKLKRIVKTLVTC